MPALLNSRKVWIAIVTFILDAGLLIIGTFAPEWMDFASKMAGLVSTLAGVLIAGIALEDAGAKAGNWPGVNKDPDAHSKS